MGMAQLIGLAINISMFLIVLALGMKARLGDATSLLRKPSLLIRSLVSMNVVMFIMALLIVFIFNPAPEIKIAIVALSLSPVPPILPGKQMKSGGTSAYSVGLLVAASVASIVLVPLGLWVLDTTFKLDMHVSTGQLVTIVLVSIILPLVIGMGVRAFRSDWADFLLRPVQIFGWIVLIIAVIPVLFTSWNAMLTLIGDGFIIALVAFTLIGLLAGHLLGGPDLDNRTVLALATSARHPGVAMAIASVNFPDMKLVLVVVLYHLLLSTVLAVPYVRWRTKLHAAHDGAH
jgi:BASS family bile acid:Na+ symporter